MTDWIAMSSWPLLVFAMVVVTAAGVVRGYAGFGFSALCVASLSFFLPLTLVVPVVLMLEVCASVFLIPSVWRLVNWRFVIGLTLSSVVAAPIGIFALHSLPANAVRFVVLCVILLACILLSRGFVFDGEQPTWRIALVGFFAGAINAAGAVGGLIFSLFLIADGLPPAQFRASLVVLFLLVDLLSSGLMAQSGLLNSEHGYWFFVLVVPLAVGVAIGSRVFMATSPQSFKRFVIGFLMVLSVIGLSTIGYQSFTASA